MAHLPQKHRESDGKHLVHCAWRPTKA